MSRARDLVLPARSYVNEDGILVEEIPVPHESKLYVRKTQIDRPAILRRNAELRKNPGAVKDISFARYQLSIPLQDYEELKKKYPVLIHGSNAERTVWYKAFIRSSESKPFRVR